MSIEAQSFATRPVSDVELQYGSGCYFDRFHLSQHYRFFPENKGEEPVVVEFGDERIYAVHGYNSSGDGVRTGATIDIAHMQGHTRVGHGKVRLDYRFPDKPFVGSTETYVNGNENFRRQGFGARRLIVMNHLTNLFFEQPLYSDITGETSLSAQSVWRRLVVEELAEEYDHSAKKRHPLWRFKAGSHREIGSDF